MILNKKNKIDKKILKTFPKEVIENIKSDVVDYFGVNINSNAKDNFFFKIYYDYELSMKKYEEYNSDSLINYLINQDMLGGLQTVYDDNNNEFARCEIGLNCLTKAEYENLFKILSKNISFFDKYKNEILKISKMKCGDPNRTSSLYFIGFKKQDSEIKTFKCHWFNEFIEIEKNKPVRKNSYYLNFLAKRNIPEFNELIPYAKSALKNCQGRLIMEGIDYNQKTSEKHKIYIGCYKKSPVYDGLIKTFQEHKEIINKINAIREWNNIHTEFCCAIFAIGKDKKNNLTLNLYFEVFSISDIRSIGYKL